MTLNEKKYSAALAPYSEREDGRRMKMSIGFLAPGAIDTLSPKEPRKVKESSGQTSTQTHSTVNHSSFALPSPALTYEYKTCHFQRLTHCLQLGGILGDLPRQTTRT